MAKTTINGVTIAYNDRGKGDAVLFVHGFPLNKSMWKAQLASLCRHYRCIAPDLRGHGNSQDIPGAYTVDLLADDLKGLLSHLGLRRVTLVGFSMGGYVAFAFYRKYPDSVKSLVLADTRPQPDSPETKQGREATAQTVLWEGTAGTAKALTPRMLAPASQQNPALVQSVQDMMTSTSVNGWVGDLRGLAARPDSMDTLAKITCPTLILVGDQDGVTPPPESHLMAERIKGAKLETIPQAGHLSPLEQPRVFNRALRQFLES